MSNADALRGAIAQIEAGNHDAGRAQLVADLTEAGAKMGEKPKGSGIFVIQHLGVKCQSTAGVTNALTVWTQKARRALMEAGE